MRIACLNDCGNVVYKDFLAKILDSDKKMNEIFGVPLWPRLRRPEM